MAVLTLGDGTSVLIDDNPDVSLPLVILLHGFGATSTDMTAPLTARSGVAFDRTAAFPLYRDEGFHFTPPGLPVAGFFSDPPLTAVPSWRDALNAAGFSTVSYTQSSAAGPIAPNIVQLNLLAGALSTNPMFSGLRFAIVAHSRGGLIARAFLAAAARIPALSGFMARMTALVTLHSPHLGTGIATNALAVDGLAARLAAVLAAAGIPPPGVLTMLRGLTGNPALGEMTPGSPFLLSTAASEPAPGVVYHTFGGTSAAAVRLWANVFTPDSGIPLPVPFPLFHWGSTPVVVGTPLDIGSFAPIAVLAPMPIVTEIMATLAALAALTPELAPGAGDVLVSNASAHLPFSATRTANPINHAEALWDPILQAQVVAILARLRSSTVSGKAAATITPFPASLAPAQHTVTAVDSVTGVALSNGTVTVYDTFDQVALRVPLGSSFTFGFAKRRVRVFDPETKQWTWEVYLPSVEVELPSPFGTIGVDIGRG